MIYKWLISLLFVSMLAISGCQGVGTGALTSDAEDACYSIEKGEEVCDAIGGWTIWSALYKEVNRAHLDSNPQILGLEQYKFFVKRLDNAGNILTALDTGQSDIDDAAEVLNAIILDLIQAGVLEATGGLI